MHSSRLRAVHYSGRHLGRGGAVCLGGVWQTSPPVWQTPPL